MEPRRCMRFVCIWPTGVGVGVWALRAAVAAALERLALEALLARKACDAARVAADEELVVSGRCMVLSVRVRG